MNKYKLVVNGLSGEIDEFTNNGKILSIKDNSNVLKDLVNELEFFKGTEKFKLPF
jgi:hypothetical protein